jgi:hypothetical protein
MIVPIEIGLYIKGVPTFLLRPRHPHTHGEKKQSTRRREGVLRKGASGTAWTESRPGKQLNIKAASRLVRASLAEPVKGPKLKNNR